MKEPKASGDGPDDERDRRRMNLRVLILVAIIVIAGVWLANKLVEMRRIQECLDSGRHDCAPIGAPGGISR